MTAPVNNANFTTPAAPGNRQGSPRADGDATAAQARATRDDSLTLASRPTEPAADSGIASSDTARATLERLKQLLADDPAGALRAHGNIDPQSAAGTLSLAA